MLPGFLPLFSDHPCFHYKLQYIPETYVGSCHTPTQNSQEFSFAYRTKINRLLSMAFPVFPNDPSCLAGSFHIA